mgnify:CR=1 FL=1
MWPPPEVAVKEFPIWFAGVMLTMAGTLFLLVVLSLGRDLYHQIKLLQQAGSAPSSPTSTGPASNQSE